MTGVIFGSIYGAPSDCIWELADVFQTEIVILEEVLTLLEEYGISSGLHLVIHFEKGHLSDRKCNEL